MKVPASVASAVGAVIDGSTAHSLERPDLDFKQADRDLRKLLSDVTDAAMCFANGAGGYLVVGVANRPGGLAALKGCTASIDEVGKGIFERTTPGLVVDVAEYRHPKASDVRLLVIEVAQGTEVYSVGGKVTLRMGTECQALSPAEVHRLYTARLKLDLTAESTLLDINALSASAVEVARRRLRAMPEGGQRSPIFP